MSEETCNEADDSLKIFENTSSSGPKEHPRGIAREENEEGHHGSPRQPLRQSLGFSELLSEHEESIVPVSMCTTVSMFTTTLFPRSVFVVFFWLANR